MNEVSIREILGLSGTTRTRIVRLHEQKARGRACLALQRHPNAWDDKRWEGFVKIAACLQAQGCVFMKPSEYLAQVARQAK